MNSTNTLVLVVLLVLCCYGSLWAETIVSADITGTEVWKKEEGPYLIKNDITITASGDLTIEAGTVVKFQTPSSPHDNIRVKVKGIIRALGFGQTRRVVFTSSKDDVFGGDTNLDGLANVPDFGDWLGFEIDSDHADQCIFRNCLFRYGGFSPNTYGAIRVLRGTPTIEKGYFYRCAKDIVVRGTAQPKIKNNEFERTGWTPISMSINAHPHFEDNTFKNVGLEFLGLESGPYFLNGRYELSQRRLAGIANIPYFIQRDISIESEMTLTIAPGVIIKFNVPPVIEANPRLTIRGTLHAVGNLNEPIVFTSERDDEIGGDGNNDGSANPPGPGDWFGIEILPSGSSSILGFCHFRYGGYHPNDGYGALRLVGSQPRISHSVFLRNSKGAVITNGARPIFKKNHFEENAWVPLSMALNTGPNFEGNTFKKNSVEAVGIEPGIYDDVDPLLLKKLITDDLKSLPYFIQDDIIIESGSQLDIQAGVILKFNTVSGHLPHVGIKVRGRINMLGTTSDPIVLTSERDDLYGGDTNNDGDANQPGIGDWWGIQLDLAAAPALIEHCLFRYGGYSNDAYGAVYMEGGNHEIRHCTFFRNSKGIVLKGDAVAHISDNTFEHCGWMPISKSFAAQPLLSNNTFKDNMVNALGLEGGTYLKEAKYHLDNWKSSTHEKVVYFVHDDIVLGPKVELDIDPGVILKFDIAPRLEENYRFTVKGRLHAVGTEELPIVFTSERDDEQGGDTNNNGGSNHPSFGDWMGLELESPAASRSVIQHCIFAYGGYRKLEGGNEVQYGALRIKNASPEISNNLFSHNFKHLIIYGKSQPKISNNQFRSSAKVAVSKSIDAKPIFQANSFERNAVNALGLEAGVYDALPIYHLEKTSFNGNPNIPFYLDGKLEIEAGSQLKIMPGVVFRFAQNPVDEATAGMLIRGRLLAEGTVEEPIVFTSSCDNQHGGVIHRDAQPEPAPGDWSGLEIVGEEGTVIRNCHFRYGGFDSAAAYGALRIVGSNPQLEHCVFEQNEKALVVYNRSDFLAHDCEYLNNEIGISVEEGSLQIVNNRFMENREYDIENLSVDPLYAENNEWSFINLVQIATGGDNENLDNIFDRHDDLAYGKVHLSLQKEPDYFLHDVYPKEAAADVEELLLTIQGFRFHRGTRVILRKEWVPDIVTWALEEQANHTFELQVEVSLADAPPGQYDVIVINPDGHLMKIEKGFRILGEERELEELLVQNFPNPFTEETQIRFAVPQSGPVKVDIFGENGLITVLLDQDLDAGKHQLTWRGEEGLAGGIYYCRLTIGEHVEVKRMVYIRE